MEPLLQLLKFPWVLCGHMDLQGKRTTCSFRRELIVLSRGFSTFCYHPRNVRTHVIGFLSHCTQRNCWTVKRRFVRMAMMCISWSFSLHLSDCWWSRKSSSQVIGRFTFLLCEWLINVLVHFVPGLSLYWFVILCSFPSWPFFIYMFLKDPSQTVPYNSFYIVFIWVDVWCFNLVKFIMFYIKYYILHTEVQRWHWLQWAGPLSLVTNPENASSTWLLTNLMEAFSQLNFLLKWSCMCQVEKNANQNSISYHLLYAYICIYVCTKIYTT